MCIRDSLRARRRKEASARGASCVQDSIAFAGKASNGTLALSHRRVGMQGGLGRLGSARPWPSSRALRGCRGAQRPARAGGSPGRWRARPPPCGSEGR
eukprot:5920604-Alexandrium_andersonii.AAC.1